MRYLNLFYVSVVGIGMALFLMLRPELKNELSFYGFAESNETEINYNYPVVVDQILVKPGQPVKAGEVLMHISRRKSKDVLEDQNFKIAELKAEEAIWQQKKENQLEEIELTRQTKLSEIENKIYQARKELEYKKSLSENLKTISPSGSVYNPFMAKIKELENEKSAIIKTFELRLESVKKEMNIGNSPLRQEIKRLNAELEFEASQKIQSIVVTAPTDGLIGNINCKEEEHIPSYTTLLSFYEPHSGIIKGYVHEDLTLEVQLGDKFKITSLKDDAINYEGRVIGLGSRIVEIPSRLRKVPNIKSFGREVLLEITKSNSFLQKEKVGINFITNGI